MRQRDLSVARRLVGAQVVVLLILACVGLVALWFQARSEAHDAAVATSVAVARSVADNPFVLEALASPDPSAELEPYAVRLKDDTGIAFVTIMRPDRIRYTHPDPQLIGQPYTGTVQAALDGGLVTETHRGSLGRTARAVVPITDGDEVVALVATGVKVDDITSAVWRRVPWIAGAVLAFFLAGTVSAAILGRYLERVTGGRGPEQLAQMFASYESVLHNVREGLLVVDGDRRLVLSNDHASELLGWETENVPRPVSALDLPGPLHELLESGRQVEDEVFLTADRVLVVSQEPTSNHGAVVTIRDRTELEDLASEVQSMRTLSDALRSATHEHANRLHTIVAMIEIGRPEEARRLATSDLAASQELVDQMVDAGSEPVLTSLLLGKVAQAAERGVELHLDIDRDLDHLVGDPGDLVTVVGNLVDNALDAAVEAATDSDDDQPWIEVYLGTAEPGPGDTAGPGPSGASDPVTLVVQVSDSGPGIANPKDAFRRGYSTKDPGVYGRGYGLALVHQAVTRRRGTIEIEREPRSVVTVLLPRTVALRADGRRRTPDALPDSPAANATAATMETHGSTERAL